jgi:hypothetical protein
MLNDQKRNRVLGLSCGIFMGIVAMHCGLGCAIQSQARHAEPDTILVRNMSGAPLSWVVLAEARKKAGQSVRLGRISPVPAGSVQGMGRPSNAPALPLSVAVRWADAYGQEYESEVSLTEILKKATGVPEEALVFRIFARGQLDVVLEYERP